MKFRAKRKDLKFIIHGITNTPEMKTSRDVCV